MANAKRETCEKVKQPKKVKEQQPQNKGMSTTKTNKKGADKRKTARSTENEAD